MIDTSAARHGRGKLLDRDESAHGQLEIVIMEPPHRERSSNKPIEHRNDDEFVDNTWWTAIAIGVLASLRETLTFSSSDAALTR